jgi:hypothetical protein
MFEQKWFAITERIANKKDFNVFIDKIREEYMNGNIIKTQLQN